MVFPDPFTAALISAVVLILVIRLIDVYEREPLWLLAVMALWGAAGATLISVVGNGFVSGLLSEDVDAVWGAAISAPIVEELAKGLALVALFLASRWTARRWGLAEFDGPTDGMVYGAAVGMGFAFSENNFYFLQQGDLAKGYEVLQLREGFLNVNTLSHGIYTGIFGAGLGLATWTRDRVTKVTCVVSGLAIAMFLHAFHNGLLSAVLVREYGFDATADALGGRPIPADLGESMSATAEGAITALRVVDYALVVLFLVALVLWSRHQRRVLRDELREEVAGGLISGDEARLAERYGARLGLYAKVARAGQLDRLRQLRHAYRGLADLAFAKWRLRVAGGDPAVVERRRAELRRARQQDASV